MKKKTLFIGTTLMTFAVFLVAVSYGSRHENKAEIASQEAILVSGKEDISMEKEQNNVIRELEFENDRVAVVRFRFSPHARIPMHAAPDLVAIWLTDARLKLAFPDGTSKVESRKAGEVEWESAQKHAGENLADTPLEFIAIQLKGGANGFRHGRD
jgi:quercetin dioxygenase-like cupin family protein